MATGYHILTQGALPLCFWQEEDEETRNSLDALKRSFKQYGLCWIIWDQQNELLYEQRDLYRCQIVEVYPQDILDRCIPFGDLLDRSSCSIFFSSERIREIVKEQPSVSRPASMHPEKARVFLASVSSDDVPGPDPVGSLEIAVPLSAFLTIADRARYGAARRGKHTIKIQRSHFFLKAALLVLDQQADQEDALRRQECFYRRERLQRVLTSLRQEKAPVSIEQRSLDSYIVRVGLHPSMYQYAA